MSANSNPRKTKRLSGNEYRKKKAKKIEIQKSLTGSLNKFLQLTNCTADAPDPNINIYNAATANNALGDVEAEAVDNDSASCSGIHLVHLQRTVSQLRLANSYTEYNSTKDQNDAAELTDQDEESLESESSTEDLRELELLGAEIPKELLPDDDPALWPFPISTKDRDYLVKKGPVQLTDTNFFFPVDDKGRRFTSRNYYRKLANGESVLREWLVYSKALDSVYCFPCKLFSSLSDKYASIYDKTGFCDWKHLSEMLSSHEVAKIHVVNFNKWKMLQKSFKSNTTIDATHQRIFESHKEHWKTILERLISIILFLAGQNLAFRGASEKLHVHNNGNFLKTVELLAKYDHPMKEHLNKIENSTNLQRRPHYLGHNIHNELIQHISNNIKRKIIHDIQSAKYFSIILDCTPDKNRVEQLTIILRYVKLNPVSVKESFIDYCPVNDTTGQGLTEVVLSKIRDLDLDIQNLRGQGYDNGSNMRGKNAGVQNKILNVNNRAMFVPCAAHSLNLVINDAVKTTFEAVNFFSLVQAIYVFFSASTQRWSILKEKLKFLTLKPLSETRWESRIDSVKALKYQIGDVYDALVNISDDLTKDAAVRNEANSLAKKINRFDFLVCVVLWYEVLLKINLVSKLLQSPNLNVIQCTRALESLASQFESCRNDKYFQEILVDAAELANELEIEAKFCETNRARPRKKTKQFLYEAKDEPINDPQQKFKVEIFFVVMDTVIRSIEERFHLMKAHSDYFSFLYDNSAISTFNKEDLTKHCMDLECYLTEGESKDLNGLELKDELSSLSVFSENEQEQINTPLKMLEFIYSNNLEGIVPNAVTALRILLTLPISVASGERSFSKLKIIENYLRSSMSQERLSGLALISIEHEIARNLNYNELITSFAEKKARKKL